MICYRCGVEAGNGSSCRNCGADLKLFQKAIRISNGFYNIGLQKVEVRDLSGAIISLKNSLKFNKNNIDARNLLGLVYYEMGEIVDALREWVISQSYGGEDNIANRYIDEIQKNKSFLSSTNLTIKKYNQSLYYCKHDSRDLAIIQLKKVLSLNPKLVKAHQLLALLYIQEDKLDLAKKTLRQVGKIDVNNTITLRYLKEVNCRLKEKGRDKKAKTDDLISYKSGNETIIMPKRFQESSIVATLIYVLIGVLIGLSVTYFLAVPSVKKRVKNEASKKMVEANDTISSNAQTISALEKNVEDLQKQLEESKNQPVAVPEQIAAYDQLLSGYAAYQGDDYMTAGQYLSTVEESYLSDAAKAVYSAAWTAVSEKYYEQVYKDGYKHYADGEYDKAIEKFLIVLAVDEDYKKGNAAYYIAQSYRKNDNTEAAKPYYQYVIDHYPNTERGKTAKNYINKE